MSSTRPALLAALRAHLACGLDVAAASRACGVTDDCGRGQIRRHGRMGPPPANPATVPMAGSPRPGRCHWPTSNGRPWLFCDAPTRGGPYCAEHQQRAYLRDRSRRGGEFILHPMGVTSP